MNRFSSSLAALALSATAMLPATMASAKIETLGECYAAVINWCNDNFPEHAGECGSSQLDECDEMFGNIVGGLELGLSAGTSHPPRAGNDDDDDDRPRPPRATAPIVATFAPNR